MLSRLLQSPAAQTIHEIWALDCVNQGDSAILNRDTIGPRCESCQTFDRSVARFR